ncbi:MAG: riboflavin biosynthesis protein RibD, partial [Achromobacter piechaudii]
MTTSTESDDIFWMRRALALAESVLYTTAPNPRVGCVIVRDGRMLGEGAT